MRDHQPRAELEDSDEQHTGGDECDPDQASGRHMPRLEAHPTEMIDDERRHALAGDDQRNERRGPELRRGDDRADDVEGAERAPDPDPPGAWPSRPHDGSGLKTRADATTSMIAPTRNDTNAARTGLCTQSASSALMPAWNGSTAPAAKANRR